MDPVLFVLDGETRNGNGARAVPPRRECEHTAAMTHEARRRIPGRTYPPLRRPTVDSGSQTRKVSGDTVVGISSIKHL